MSLVSNKIRAFARGKDCSLRLSGPSCFDSSTTILAHIGRSGGMGQKCDDTFAIYACAECHAKIDNFAYDWEAEGVNISEELLRALEETQSDLIRNELIKVPK